MPEDKDNLTETAWTVTLRPAGLGVADPETETVIAAYHRFEADRDFIQFKDAQHQIVFTVSASCVVSIKRGEALSLSAPLPF